MPLKLLIFIVYLLILGSISTLVTLTKIFPDFSFSTYSLSNLGSTITGTYYLFQLFVVLNILIGKTLAVIFLLSFKRNRALYITISFLLIFSTSAIATLFFPQDRSFGKHLIISFPAFLAIFGFSMSTIPIILSSSIPNWTIIFNLLMLFLPPGFIVSLSLLNRKYGEILKNFSEIRSAESSFLLRNTTLLEWSLLIVIYLWIVIVCTYLLREKHPAKK